MRAWRPSRYARLIESSPAYILSNAASITGRSIGIGLSAARPSAIFATGTLPLRIRGTVGPRLNASVGECVPGISRDRAIQPSVLRRF